MSIEYLACGNIMSDRIEDQNGNLSEWNMGGPAFYALSGMRMWTKECKLVCKTGADYTDTYGKWMEANGITQESVRVELEHHNRYTLKYNDNGSFQAIPKYNGEHLGYLKTHADDVDKAADGYSVRGMYMAQNLDAVVWENLRKVKQRRSFRIMWEIEYGGVLRKMWDLTREQILDKVRNALNVADAWSINSNEAADMFNLPKEDDAGIINELQKLPTEFTFYRVGSRGSFAVTKTNAYFCPVIKPFGESVDPTGCGNCSTGAAAYALFSGEHPAMTAAMANVAGGYNAAQRGPYPLYTAEVMSNARIFAQDAFSKMKETQKF